MGKTASGKSTVASYIAKFRTGVLVIDADQIAKEIYSKDKQVLNNLKDNFGKEIFNANEKLKMDVLARKVFSSKIELMKLNRLMFPLIREEIKKILKENTDKNYIVIDAAVLFDCKLDLLCDYVIQVKSRKERRKRLLKKKNKSYTEDEVNMRIKGQHIKVNKNKIDYVIENNSSVGELYNKTENVLKNIEENEKIK